MTSPKDAAGYDVVILGAGLSGSLTACILAKNGFKVLLADAGTHPRFTIGESTTATTSTLFLQLSRQYNIPEIGDLRGSLYVQKNIGTTHGIKKVFGFIYHRPGQEPDPKEAHQIGVNDNDYRGFETAGADLESRVR